MKKISHNFGAYTIILARIPQFWFFSRPGGERNFSTPARCFLLATLSLLAYGCTLPKCIRSWGMREQWQVLRLCWVCTKYSSSYMFALTRHLLILLALHHRYSLHFGHRTNSLLCTYVPGSQTNNRAVMSGLIKALQVSCLPNNHAFFENIPII